MRHRGGKGIGDLSDGEIELVRSTVAGVSDVHVLNVLRLMSGASEQIRLGASPRISIEGALITAAKLGVAFGFEDLPPVTPRVSVTAVGKEAPPAKTPEDAPRESAKTVEKPAEKPEPVAEPVQDNGDEDTREKENSHIREISGLFDMIPEDN